MQILTSDLRVKFLAFREAYEHELARLLEREVKGTALAKLPYQQAQLEVPLTPSELHLYKKLVALHSVNGGELFGIGDDEAD